VQNFGDLATLSVDYCILYSECPPYFYLRFVWPTNLESIPHASTPTSIIRSKFEAPTPIPSWVICDNVSHWLPLKMRTQPLRMHRITWLVSRGSKTITFLESSTQICLFTIQLLFGLRRRLRVVYSRASPMPKTLTAQITCAWPCDLDLWPFDLEQLSFMASHVSNLATKYEDPTPIRSWVTSYNGSHWLALEMRTQPLRIRRITRPVSNGSKTIIYLESTTAICLFTILLL